jgi:hypothetical protein
MRNGHAEAGHACIMERTSMSRKGRLQGKTADLLPEQAGTRSDAV